VKTNKSLDRRDFLVRAGATSLALTAAPMSMFARAAGKPVEPMSLLTSNASFDPVRPEMGRLITQACKGIGWNVNGVTVMGDAPRGTLTRVRKLIKSHDPTVPAPD